MTISILQASDGNNGNSATSVSKAFTSDVTAGSLVIIWGGKWSGSSDPFVAGDCTKIAGTATLGAITLDQNSSAQTDDAGNSWASSAIWSAVVTGSGTLTMEVGGAPAGSYLLMGLIEASGNWDGTRVEATNGATSATDGTSTATTGNGTSAGAALFVAGLQLNSTTGTAITEDGAFTLVYENSSSTDDNGSVIYRNVGTGTTDAGDWTTGTTVDGYATSLVVYKEAAASTTVTQAAHRFGVDDGSESAHTWAAGENSNLTAPANTAKLLRVQLNASGDPASKTYKIKCQKDGTGGYSDVPIGAGGSSPTIGTPTIGTVAYSSSGGTSVAPGYPASIAANDTLVLIVGQKPSAANSGTCTTPAGWTLQAQRTGATDGDTGGYTTTLGVDTGNTNIYVYTKDSVTGSESGTLSVTVGTNNVCWGAIVLVPKTDAGTWSIAADTGKDTSAGNVSIDSSAGMAVAAADMMIGAMVIPTDVTTPAQFSAETMAQSGTTFGTMGELAEPDSTTGNDIGGFIFYQPVSSGSGSGVVTMTATAGGTTTNVRGPGVILRARVTGTPANDVYIDASTNISAGATDNTTDRLATSGGTFQAGKRSDDTNGITIDLTSDYQTEIEWCINTKSGLSGGTYFDFRVYDSDAALDAYTVTPRWTIGAASYNLAVDYATATVSAQAVALKAARKLAVTYASTTVTATDFLIDRSMAVTYATAAVVLQDVTLSYFSGYTLAVDYSSVTVSAQSVGLYAGRVLAADYATLTASTQSVGLLRDARIAVDYASAAVAAQDVGLLVDRNMPVAYASVAASAQDVTLTYAAGYSLAVDHASAAVAAQDVGLFIDRALAVDYASVAVAAQDVTLTYTAGYSLTVDTATVTAAAQAVGLFVDRVLAVGAATITVSPQTVGLVYGNLLTVDPATVTATAQDVGLRVDRVLAVAYAAAAVDAIAVTLTWSGEIKAEISGAEYSLPDNRLHYTIGNSRLHSVLPDGRLHYTQKEG